MNRKQALAIILVILNLQCILTITMVYAHGTVDQYKEPYGGPSYYWEYNPSYSFPLMQEFTARKSNLIGIDLYLHGYEFPTNEFLRVSISGPGVGVTKYGYYDVAAGYSWVHIDLDSPVYLTRNAKYTILLHPSSFSWVANGYSYANYYGGQAYVGGNPNPNLDFCFRTYYDPSLEPTPPTITISSVTPDVLWPPNHQLCDVEVDVSWSDDEDPSPTVTVYVSSNEPIDGTMLGDGATEPDYIMIDNWHFKLRAERDGVNTDRVYTITYIVTDSSGLSSVAYARVTVPHDLAR